MIKTKIGNRGVKVEYRSFCLRKGGLTALKNRTDCKFLVQLTIAKMLSSCY